MLASIFFFLFTPSAQAFGSALQEYFGAPVDPAALQSMMTHLSTQVRAPDSCNCRQACSFAEVCSQLPRTPGVPHLFRFPDGSTFPNPIFDFMANQLFACGTRYGGAFTAGATDEFSTWSQRANADDRSAMEHALEMYAIRRFGAGRGALTAADLPAFLRSAEESSQIHLLMNRERREFFNQGLRAAFARMVAPRQVNWNSIPAGPVRDALTSPFTNPAVLTDAGVVGQRARARYAEARQQVDVIRRDVQNRILRVLEARRRRFPAGSPQARALDNMVQRISSIRFNLNPSPNEMNSSCRIPNAFYRAEDHTFVMCPSIMGSPETRLAQVIAHELGHSIDPCIMANDSYAPRRYNPSAATQLAFPDGSRGIVALLEPGAIPGIRWERVREGLRSEEENPFQSALACLANTTGAQRGSLARMEGRMRDLRQSLARVRDASARTEIQGMIESLQGRIEYVRSNNLLDQYPNTFCSPYGSNFQETFSDLISYEAMAQPGRAYPDIPQAYFHIPSCYTQEAMAGSMRGLRTQLTQMGCIPQAYTPPIYGHQSESVRVDNVMFRNPTLRARFGCEPIPGGSCADQ